MRSGSRGLASVCNHFFVASAVRVTVISGGVARRFISGLFGATECVSIVILRLIIVRISRLQIWLLSIGVSKSVLIIVWVRAWSLHTILRPVRPKCRLVRAILKFIRIPRARLI